MKTVQIRNVKRKHFRKTDWEVSQKPDSLSAERTEWVPAVEASVAKCSWEKSGREMRYLLIEMLRKVKCANWKLAENPTLSFKPRWLGPNMRWMGRYQRKGDICKQCGNVSALFANLRIHMKTTKRERKTHKCGMISGRWIGGIESDQIMFAFLVFWSR